jgi:hypothetical protein
MFFESKYSHDDSSNDCDDRHDVTDVCSLLYVVRVVEDFQFIFALSWLISNLMHKIIIYLHIIHLFKSSTCFEHCPAHLQEVYAVIVYMQPLVSSLSAGDWPSCAPVQKKTACFNASFHDTHRVLSLYS